jgi:ABC-type antimicrobial peptide transport system permease subunit
MGAAFFGAFALLALTLASIGTYGVASYVAALRTREIGIRIALGADRHRIRALMLRQGAVPVALGVAAGLGLALAAGRLAAAFLRGVSPHDPATYAGVTLLLVGIVAVATWLPARRAARLDPLQALTRGVKRFGDLEMWKCRFGNLIVDFTFPNPRFQMSMRL